MNTFREKIYQVVKKIKKGKVLSYKIVAKLAGFPQAWRVVGNILNENKDKKIPCHRVIRSDGKIGGYRYGTKRKTALLKKEGVVVRKWKVIFQYSFKRRQSGRRMASMLKMRSDY